MPAAPEAFAFCAAACVYSAVIGTWRRLHPEAAGEENQVAWVLSICNSAFVTACGVPYALRVLTAGVSIDRCAIHHRPAKPHRLLTSPIPAAHSVFVEDAYSRSLCAAFAAYLLCDLGYGARFYRSQCDPFTTVTHHIVYLVLMLQLLFVTPASVAFGQFAVEELPTFLLSLGHYDKRYRTNWGFGGTFFVLRIAYHGRLVVFHVLSAWRGGAGHALWPYTTAAMVLHATWFKAWIAGQRKRMAKAKGGKKKKKVV